MNEDLESISSPESTSEKITRLLQAAQTKLGLVEFYKLRVSFARTIQKNNPVYDRYRAYHLLIGSGITESPDVIEGDLPGDDSVVKFLGELLK